MSKRPRDPHHALLEFLQATGGCAPSQLLGLLKSGKLSPDIVIAASLAMLSSRDPDGERPPDELLQVPLDAIVASGHPLAEQALRLVAEQARNSLVKLQAAKRLGRIATSRKSHECLRELIGEGTVAPRSYVSDSITADTMKEAALRSLGEVKKPTKADSDVILESILQEVDDGRDAAVFRAGTQALGRIVRASDLGRVLDLAEKCSQKAMALRVLCACRNLTRRTLLKQKARIAHLFVRSLDAYQAHTELHVPATELARRLSCAELVKGLSGAYSDDCLDQARGQVSATALGAYSPVDDSLTAAYLAFARASCNANTKGPCLRGLKRCAEAGQTGRIIAKLVQQDQPGYRHLLTSGAVMEVAGGMKGLVANICDSLDAVNDTTRRSQAAERCIVGTIMASVGDVEGAPTFDDLKQFRQRCQQHPRGQGTPLQTLVSLLCGVQAEHNGLFWLARRLTSDEMGEGAVTLAQCLLAVDDDLSRLFIEQVFHAAATCDKLAETYEGTSLHRVEDLAFSCCDKWLSEELGGFLMLEGRLNRYALDVMRRRHRDFTSRARQALAEVQSREDAIAVLSALSRKGDQDSIRILGEAASFVCERVSEAPAVRKEALRLIKDAVGQRTSEIPTELRDELLSGIHQRFEDTSEVRLLAYEVAGAVAAPVSILPLRSRQESDLDPKGKRQITTALERIQQRLSDERPNWSESDNIKLWLKHVGDLGDEALLGEVMDLLATPHPDRDVLVAALNCLGELRSREAISAIDRFISQISPSAEVLQAARRAKAVLMDREDLPLLDALASVFPHDSPVLDFEIDYQVTLGARLLRVARSLDEAMEQYRFCHWGVFVTKLDAVCDVLVRRIYVEYPSLLGIDKSKGETMARQEYANRLAMAAFRTAFPAVHPLLDAIHVWRNDAKTAHVEDSDGTEKPGVGKEEADLALEHFRIAFMKLVPELKGVSGLDT